MATGQSSQLEPRARAYNGSIEPRTPSLQGSEPEGRIAGIVHPSLYSPSVKGVFFLVGVETGELKYGRGNYIFSKLA
jgi:hypothetical protein